MGQISQKLRKVRSGYAHWCPGCEEVHILPDSWKFDGNLENPTFSPSFKHSGVKRKIVNGEWIGEWERDVNGVPLNFICHYNLIRGDLHYCADSTHAMRGKVVPLPALPEYLKDSEFE
jgi:hypothetical protein